MKKDNNNKHHLGLGIAPTPADFEINNPAVSLPPPPQKPPTPKRDLITMALESRANDRLKMEISTFQKHLCKHPLYAAISKLQVNISKGGLPYFNGTLYDFFNSAAPDLIKETLLESYIDEEAVKLLQKIELL